MACRSLEKLKGVIETEFALLSIFEKYNKKFPNLEVTVPDSEDLRQQLLAFLAFNDTKSLTLRGGSDEQVNVSNVH